MRRAPKRHAPPGPTPQQIAAALERVETADDPAALSAMMANAARLGAPAVRDAAFRRYVLVSAEGEPGTVAHDFWSAIHALEKTLSEERGKTTRLSRTRQKLARDGAVKTVSDLATAAQPSEGFAMLVDRGMDDLTAEAVALRHAADFAPEVLDAARARLAAAVAARAPQPAEA